MTNDITTKVIDNFQGRLTRYTTGDLNSGYARYQTTYGNDPFSSPGNLTWFESPTQIDPNASVITDLIMAARPRLESGITYVYAIGHTGRLYKIQVNQPSAHNPNLDNPVLLTTLIINTPTFKYGSSIQFYGSTEKIYIGHDKGITSINYDGTGEAFVGVLGSYTVNVPRPSVNFTGVTYWGNGNNILTIDSTGTVTTYAQLSPSFPVGTIVRDIDVSPDGNYAQIVVSRIPASDLTSTTQDTASLSSADSYLIYWNGTDTGYTSYNPYNSYSLNSNISFGPYGYTMGYDLGGAAIYKGGTKIISLPDSIAPNFAAMFSTGNLMGFISPEHTPGGQQQATVSIPLLTSAFVYGAYDKEVPEGLYRLFKMIATGNETDIIQVPTALIVSNLFYGSSSAGYTNNQIGSAKVYFSTLETSSGPTTKYRFYKFTTVPTGVGTSIGGVYETQTQLFSKKIKVSEVRIYIEPFVQGIFLNSNQFTIELIGSNGGVITGTDKTFTGGTSPNSIGDDFCWYNPTMAPTYALGVRITNLGMVNMVFNKIEIDYSNSGK